MQKEVICSVCHQTILLQKEQLEEEFVFCNWCGAKNLLARGMKNSDLSAEYTALQQQIAAHPEDRLLQLQLKIWRYRYGNNPPQPSGPPLPDRMIGLWTDLLFLAQRTTGWYQKGVTRRMLMKILKEVAPLRHPDCSLFDDYLLDSARKYLSFCLKDRQYTSSFMGMIKMHNSVIYEKLSHDVILITRTLPDTFHIKQEDYPFRVPLLTAFEERFSSATNS